MAVEGLADEEVDLIAGDQLLPGADADFRTLCA